jgi:DNA-binding TFAR19-related protein (PDSD5 family)
MERLIAYFILSEYLEHKEQDRINRMNMMETKRTKSIEHEIAKIAELNGISPFPPVYVLDTPLTTSHYIFNL